MIGAPVAHPPRPAPPVVASPHAHQVSFGAVWGTVDRRTRRVSIRIGTKVVARERVRRGRYAFSLKLPRRDFALRVTAIGRGGRASTSVAPVFGLPRRASPVRRAGYKKPALQRRLRRMVRRYRGVGAFYVKDLTTGAGAAWNAAARFPAASTLKLAIAVEVLRSIRGGPPHAHSYVGSLVSKMLRWSDNRAANALLGTVGGGWRVDATMQALGLRDSLMFGGYLPGTRPPPLRRMSTDVRRRRRAPIPIEVVQQPSFGLGKYSSAHDLGRLVSLVHLAAGRKGALVHGFRGWFTVADARYLLFELAHVSDPGKLGRYLHGGGTAVLHKAGWIHSARHDNGLVYWPGGVFVATVMTWNPSGTGASSDVLAGRAARAALRIFRHLRR